MKKLKNLFIVAFLVLTLMQCQNKSENSQWRGNNRDGIYTETGLLTEWPEEGPELLWSTDSIPQGFSSISIANDLVYTTGMRDSMDILFAVDMQGNIKWEVAYGKGWTQSFPPSRSTPVVEGEKVFVTSGTGHVGCFNALTGEEIWLYNISERYEGTFGAWGIAESPLIDGDKLFFSPGGKNTTMLALDKNTGEVIWESESIDDTPAYASPILAIINNTKVIITVLSHNLIGINADNGEILFHKDYASISDEVAVAYWEDGPLTNTNNPIYKEYQVYLTSGYNHVGVMFDIAKDLSKAEVKWIDTTLDVHHGGAVLIDNYIYGSNWINNRVGNWCCIDWETGKTMYETEWNTKGSIISAEGNLYCYEEKDGNIALVEATPEGFNVISSFKVPLGKGPHWSHPVIKDGVLYIRHMDALMAYNIKKE